MSVRFKFLVFCFILAAFAYIPAHGQNKSLKEADALFKQFNYALALPAYKKVLKEQKASLYVTQRIADAYRLMNNPKEAEFWYDQVLSFPNHDPIMLKYTADAARKNGKYSKAKQLYLQYGQRVPTQTAEVARLAAACDNALQWIARPELYELQKQTGLNSANSDFGPVFYQNGLVFTSDRGRHDSKDEVYGWTGKPFLKLYYAPKTSSNAYSTPVALDPVINSKYHNGSATFTADGQTIYFTRINQVKNKGRKADTDPFSWTKLNAGSNYINRLGIYTAQKQGEKWDKPKPFAYNQINAYSVGHPALSPDGQTLYFVSDMPGSLGQTDIFYCTKQTDGSWSRPINAGKAINTPNKELFPLVSPTGTLYFSSEGHSGMGGLDIFSATGAGATWSQVQNLKYPLNSSADDFGIIFDETKEAGFLSSNRDSEDGADDIYAFKKVKVTCNLAGKTVERTFVNGLFKEHPIGNVLVQLIHTGDSTVLKTYSDAQGNFTFAIKDGLNYTLKATKEGYLTRSAGIAPTCQSVLDMVKLSMALNRNTLNKPIILENIYYDFDKYDIRPDAVAELDKLVNTLKDNPTIKIEIGSHTDSRQSKGYNQFLSQLRAESAVNYIISQGIAPGRLVAKGYGETRLLNNCQDGMLCSELEHQINRRTEFKLLSR